MMASSTLPYIAEPLGKIDISQNPVKPNGKIILILSVCFSAFFSIIFIILFDKIKND